MAEIKQRKRVLKWWMESNEVPDEDGRRLEEFTRGTDSRVQEKYDASRLRPGWSGRDAPPVEQMGSGYAGQDARFDKLGKDQSTAEKPKKGMGQKKTPDVKEKRNTRRAIQEDDLDLDMPEEGMGEDENVNPENDIPPEMDDEALEGEDSEELAQDVKVEINGQSYSLVPEEEPGMEDEMGEELPEEPMEEPNEAEMNGGVAGQDQDITQERSRKVRRTVREAGADGMGDEPTAGGDTVDYDKVLESAMREAKVKARKRAVETAIRKAIAGKKYYEKQLQELFTGSYVINKQGEVGFDFRPVAGDEDFAVVDRAASGNQFTPIDSESPYEPESKGGKTQHMTKPRGAGSYGETPYNGPVLDKRQQESKKEAFKRWLASQEAKFSEDNSTDPGYHKSVNPDEDPGDTSDEFNKQDEFGSPEPRSPIKPEQYPAIPEIMGNEKDVITPSIGQKYGQGNFVGENKYRQAQQRRQIRNEKIEVPTQQETLKEETEESFDFKAFLAGDYK
jgi:hypothetical protein